MECVSKALPALWRSEKVQAKAARVGYDWTDREMAFRKLPEELQEIREAMDAGDPDAMEEELGDLLFAAVKLARFLNIDPEAALHRSCEKFIRRFAAVEQAASAAGKALEELSLDELLPIYDAVKAAEHQA